MQSGCRPRIMVFDRTITVNGTIVVDRTDTALDSHFSVYGDRSDPSTALVVKLVTWLSPLK